jgi:hypothetical protein
MMPALQLRRSQISWRKLMALFKDRASISPRTIEVIAISAFVIVVSVGVWALWEIPKQEFTRTEILKTIEAILGGLGVSSLLLLWAQLRHTAILGKLTSYHDHFHDLPSIGKVRDLYKALGRCKVEVPTWHTPRQRLIDKNYLPMWNRRRQAQNWRQESI